MNRRGFFKFLGVSSVAVPAAVKAMEETKPSVPQVKPKVINQRASYAWASGCASPDLQNYDEDGNEIS